VRLLTAFGLAGYLLFWWFEGLSPRMRAIAKFESDLRGGGQPAAAAVISNTQCQHQTWACVPVTVMVEP